MFFGSSFIRIAFANRFVAFVYFKTFCSLTTCLIEKTKKERCLFFVLCKKESKILNNNNMYVKFFFLKIVPANKVDHLKLKTILEWSNAFQSLFQKPLQKPLDVNRLTDGHLLSFADLKLNFLVLTKALYVNFRKSIISR